MRRSALRMYSTDSPVYWCSFSAMARAFRRRKLRASRQRARIVPHRELFDLREEGFEILVLAGQFFVIPGGRGIGRQCRLVGQIDAGIAGRPIRAQVEVENLRQQDHAVEIDRAIRLELIDEHRRARRAVAFAEQIFRRIPATVFRQELRDEFGERIGILVDAVERLLLVLAGDAAETGAGRVDEHQIGHIEQARAVVDRANTAPRACVRRSL